MEQAGLRALVHQTADDLAWLEQHARRQPEDAAQAAQAGALRLAAALVRNVVGPCLDGQPPLPLHVAVVGGAGAGKSTVANFLIGSVLSGGRGGGGGTAAGAFCSCIRISRASRSISSSCLRSAGVSGVPSWATAATASSLPPGSFQTHSARPTNKETSETSRPLGGAKS